MSEQGWNMTNLAEELERARRENIRLLELLRALVSSKYGFVTFDRISPDEDMAWCNFCDKGHLRPEQIVHELDCPVAQARAAALGQQQEGDDAVDH